MTTVRLARPCVCLVTDRRRLSPDARTVGDEVTALESWLDEAIDAGVDLIQIRERDLEAAVLRAFTGGVVARAHSSRTRVVVNDRVDVALVAGADGVHLRSEGPPPERVRLLGPAAWLVGRSVHAPAEAGTFGSADYLIFGTVFPSRSKPDDAPHQGLEPLRAAAAASAAPVLAIGGLTVARAVRCAEAGAAGVAAIGLFLPAGRAPQALGIRRATQELRQAFAGVAHFGNLLQ